MHTLKNALAFALFVALGLGSVQLFAETPTGYQNWNRLEKQDYLWSQVVATEYDADKLPTGAVGLSDLLKLFTPRYLFVTFQHSGDELPEGRIKPIHSWGAVAKVNFHITTSTGYTGFFEPGNYAGIVRASLAGPPKNFTPAIALKLLVDGNPSVNMVAMYSVDGQGDNQNFFEHPFSNKIPAADTFATKLLEKAFRLAINMLKRGSEPSYLPPDNLARMTPEGRTIVRYSAPYSLIYTPRPELRQNPNDQRDFRLKLSELPAGTVLYDIAAKASENAGAVNIGELVLTTPLKACAYGDENLFFQHNF
jgi:hypothetical protein